PQAAAVTAGVEGFHSGQQAQGKVAAELLPVPRRQEGQMETVDGADHVLSLVVFHVGKDDAARYWREPRGRCGSEGGRLGAVPCAESRNRGSVANRRRPG